MLLLSHSIPHTPVNRHTHKSALFLSYNMNKAQNTIVKTCAQVSNISWDPFWKLETYIPTDIVYSRYNLTCYLLVVKFKVILL